MADEVLLIRECINEAEAALIDVKQKTEDLYGVKTKVFLLELESEIALLRNILLSPDQIGQAFLQRCIQRELDPDLCISFRELPTSITNTLYWNIATIIFSPKTMGEMLYILSPSIENHIEVTIPNRLPHKMTDYELRHFRLNFQPEIIVHQESVQSLIMPPDFALVSQLVFSDNTVLDTNDICNYPLGAHAKLKAELEKSHPELAQNLYQHNYAFQRLSNDIKKFTDNRELAPNTMIKQLIDCFLVNGQGNTGADMAADIAQTTSDNFLEYFDKLPTTIGSSLNALKYNEHGTLDDIINKQIKKGTCVEGIAKNLTTFLQINDQHQFLTEQPPASLEQIKNIEAHYVYRSSNTSNILDTNKQILQPKIWAKSLVKNAIKNIEPKSFPDFIMLLFDFSPEYYDLIFENIKIRHPEIALIALGLIYYRHKLFTQVQRHALAQAIYNNYSQIGARFSFFYWAFNLSTDPIAIVHAVKNAPKDEIIYNFSILNKDKKSLLFSAVSKPEFFAQILKNIPQPLLIPVLRLKCKGISLIEAALDYPESLCILLKQYSYPQQVGLLKKVLDRGIVIELICSEYIDSFIPVFTLISESQRLDFIINHSTIIPHLLNNPVVLKQTIDLLPADHRIKFCTTAVNSNGDTVLTLASKDRESLRIVQELIEPHLKILSSARQVQNELNEAIDHLLIHAKNLEPFDDAKAAAIIDLTNALKLKLNVFCLKASTENLSPEAVYNFQFEFCQLLHSKDDIMCEHRRLWKPILANMILVVITLGLALLAIGFKAGMQLIQDKENKSLTINNCLFFSKTKSEQKVNDLELIVDQAFSNHTLTPTSI